MQMCRTTPCSGSCRHCSGCHSPLMPQSRAAAQFSPTCKATTHMAWTSAYSTAWTTGSRYDGLLWQLTTPGRARCHGPATSAVQDGAAFLLERRGDVHSALRIHIQNLDRTNRQLVAAVRDGQLDLAQAAAEAVAAAADGQGTSPAAKLTGAGAVMRGRRSTLTRCGGNQAAAAAAALLMESGMPVPAEVQAARDALSCAMGMCLRQEAAHAAAFIAPLLHVLVAPVPRLMHAAPVSSFFVPCASSGTRRIE